MQKKNMKTFSIFFILTILFSFGCNSKKSFINENTKKDIKEKVTIENSIIIDTTKYKNNIVEIIEVCFNDTLGKDTILNIIKIEDKIISGNIQSVKITKIEEKEINNGKFIENDQTKQLKKNINEKSVNIEKEKEPKTVNYFYVIIIIILLFVFVLLIVIRKINN